MTLFGLLGETVLAASAIAAAFGCFALNRRVRRLASTERGIGKAVSEMTGAVDRFAKQLVAAEESTRQASAILDGQLAEARRLVMQLDRLRGAGPRAAGPHRTPPRAAASADPLADVVPKGASTSAPPGQAATGRTASNDSAETRLAELARHGAPIADATVGTGRGARA